MEKNERNTSALTNERFECSQSEQIEPGETDTLGRSVKQCQERTLRGNEKEREEKRG